MSIGKLTHKPCPDCGSSDGMMINEDGSSYCFVCKTFSGTKRGRGMRDTTVELLDDKISGLPSHAYEDRGIDEGIVKEYGGKAEFSETSGEITKHYYPYYKEGSLVAYKVRVIEGKIFYTHRKAQDYRR